MGERIEDDEQEYWREFKAQWKPWYERWERLLPSDNFAEGAICTLREERCDERLLSLFVFYYTKPLPAPLYTLPKDSRPFRRDLRRLIKRLHRCADQVESYYLSDEEWVRQSFHAVSPWDHELMLRFIIARYNASEAWMRQLVQHLRPSLHPVMLREIAAKYERSEKNIERHLTHRESTDAWLARLCQYVRLKTGKPHHTEITQIVRIGYAAHGRSGSAVGEAAMIKRIERALAGHTDLYRAAKDIENSFAAITTSLFAA